MASTSHLYVEQGANFSATIHVTNPDRSVFDLSNYTAKAQARERPTYSTNVEFAMEMADAINGVFTMSLTAEQTFSMSDNNTKKRWVYDCLLIGSAGEVIRLLEGDLYVSPCVTR